MVMRRHRWRWGALSSLLLVAALAGCHAFLERLSPWKVLAQGALGDPVQAVGGAAFVFAPPHDDPPLTRANLAKASPQELVAYYSPVFIQQKAIPGEQRYPYPPEYDQ